MSTFIIFAVLLMLIAVVITVRSLWKTAKPLAIGLAIAIPLASGSLYWLKGNVDALNPQNIEAPKTIEQAVAQLERHLVRKPEDFAAWVLLARSNMALERFDRARDAYAKATALTPDDSDLPVEYAEALLRTSTDHKFPPNAVRMLEQAVQKNPRNQRALFFLGIHQLQSGKPAQATALWETLLPMLPAEAGNALRQQIAQARQAAGLPPLFVAEAMTKPSLKITVRLDSALIGQLEPGASLFVFARSTSGAGPPFAVKRIVVNELPMDVTLTDADSPMPTATLFSQKTVVLMARLSRSGNAQSASGDIESKPLATSLADTGTHILTLSTVVP